MSKVDQETSKVEETDARDENRMEVWIAFRRRHHVRETTESEQEEQRTVKLEKQNIHVEKRESIIIAHPAELIITVGHRSFVRSKCLNGRSNNVCSDKLTAQHNSQLS